MESEDGGLFIKNLAYFIRTHEKALADSLLLQCQPRRRSYTPGTGSSGTSRPSTSASNLSSNAATQPQMPSGTSTSSWRSSFGRTQVKPARLFLTPNYLYYLLSRFDELGVNTGPMNIRLENLQAEPSSSNYVSFMAHTQQPKIKSYDTDSIRSVTSVKSLMSSVSSIFSNMTFSQNSGRQQARREAVEREDIRYLYSAFTKIPCLKISLDHRLKPISGYEEFPFDTAVPVSMFKNLTSFEVADIDFRCVYGWDVLADSLQSLTVKRASIEDLSELLHDVVMDDMDQRRRRSSKTPQSPMPLATPPGLSKRLPWPGSTSPIRSPTLPKEPESSEGAQQDNQSDDKSKLSSLSISPRDSGRSRRTTLNVRSQAMVRRSSGSSNSSTRMHTPRQSSTNLLTQVALPSTKWRFLKHLSVPDSGLTSISSESLLPLTETLQSLDLSGNLFSDIPDAVSSLTALRALNLSNCLVDSLRNLARSPLAAVTILNLRGNKLNSLAGIETLKSLQRLDLRDNRITDPTEAARLTGMPDFYDLFIKRNPFTTTHLKNRIVIFNLFRATPGYNDDICIDAKGPDRSERKLLVERVPLPPQSTVVDPIPNNQMLDELRAATSTFQALPPEVGNKGLNESTSQAEATRSLSQRKTKRRVAEVTDEIPTPPSRAIPEIAQSTYQTAHERLPSRETTTEHEDQGSPSLPARRVSRQTQPMERAQSQDQGRNQSPSAYSRPTASRALSQKSEVYRQRIEALKGGKGDVWQSAPKSPRVRRDQSLSPMVKHQSSSGMFSAEATASIASIRV